MAKDVRLPKAWCRIARHRTDNESHSRRDEQRISAKKRPVVPPPLAKLVRNTYFVGADLTDPLVSPAYYPRLAEFPPTLIMTAEFDTLRHEMNDLAADMTAQGVQVTHKQFAGVDHGFTHAKPVEVARESLQMIGEHLRRPTHGRVHGNSDRGARA
jgi:acetyl esterase/lipase